MFHHHHQPPDKPRASASASASASAYHGDSFAFASQQPWDRFGFSDASAPSPPSDDASHHIASAMDWTPDLIDAAFHHDANASRGGALFDDHLNLGSRHGGGGGGVGRLVAHFENKDHVPPLPPRPIITNRPSPMPSQFGSLNSVTHSSRVASPVTVSSESRYGSLGVYSPVTSPVAASRSGMSFATYHHDAQVRSPFGSMDDFMGSNRVNRPMMPPTPSLPAGVPGTPGFEIWRPPASTNPKPEPPSQITNPANFGGYFRPPVPTTPKPVTNPAGSQFILEFNPSAKAKGKAPAPAKPPRPRLPPRKPLVTPSTPTLTLTPTPAPPTPILMSPLIPTSRPSQAPSSSTPLPAQPPPPPPPPPQDSISLRTQAGTRPSREQVPAEAWEQFKPTIRTLYLEERRPLKEVMSIMADKYGFQATPKMYKTRFSQWGFVKNNTEEEVKRLLSMKFQRDAEGKVSEFVRNGRVVNLGTYLKRKGVTEYDLVDFELPADLPAHVRCRTPTPPPALRSPDLLRAQELVVGNLRKAFLHCRQFEVETETQVGWPSTMVWGTGSSDLLLEANFYFEARDADLGGDYLMRAFKQLEVDLRKLSPQGIMELILGMVNRDAGMMTALCKYLAAYSTTNLERTHPLRQIFSCLYEVQQKHGANTLSELLWGSISTIAEELEAIYGHRHPYVARTWIDLALYYNQVNSERFEKLIIELRTLQRQLEQRHGATSVDVVTLRYAILQMLYVVSPQSEATKQAALDMWSLLRSMGAVFPMRGSRPNAYCYHSLVKVDPWTKRCRRRYESGVTIMEEHAAVKLHPYFEEDFHTCEHAREPQQVWATAMQQMGSSSRPWGYI